MKVPAQPSGTALSLTKHICAICGDRSSAVQEERQRAKDRNENEVESTSCANEDMPVEKILEAEQAVEPKTETYIETNLGVPSNSPNDPVTNICQAADKQLFTLVEWAKRIPHFSELPLDDQVILLRAECSQELVSKMRDMQMDKTELGCLRAIVLFNPEMLISNVFMSLIKYESTSSPNWTNPECGDTCPQRVCGVKPQPLDSKGLSNPSEVEALREKVYASLEAYCKQKYPEQPGRFAKLLLRLPALRSIGLKCLEHLFFFKLIGDTPIDTFLMEMLEAPHQMT
ncbi:Retinoic acid receptor RXR-alpha-A [Collichthys lucidus]|uniref:Retinoic acid receptor RXR-alpha-A n=1 Tax=Collichthys lucidus TaxID=240159 RepID=A0A4U5V8S7_COLLU|nr:Retinoic acid receptor RXR-alpha-A [Collichthys lucidus]